MATALIGGVVGRGQAVAGITVVEPSAAQRDALAARFPGVTCVDEPATRCSTAVSLVVLAVKPQHARAACTALASSIHAVPALLSIAAGVRCAELARWLGGYTRIVRAMPNTPALIGAGVTGVYSSPDVPPKASLPPPMCCVRQARSSVARARRRSMPSPACRAAAPRTCSIFSKA